MEKKKKNSNLLIQGKNNNDLKLFFKYLSNPKIQFAINLTVESLFHHLTANNEIFKVKFDINMIFLNIYRSLRSFINILPVNLLTIFSKYLSSKYLQ